MLCPHKAQSVLPDSEWVAGSAETQTWLAGLGTGPAGAPLQTGASGDGRSGGETDCSNLHFTW